MNCIAAGCQINANTSTSQPQLNTSNNNSGNLSNKKSNTIGHGPWVKGCCRRSGQLAVSFGSGVIEENTLTDFQVQYCTYNNTCYPPDIPISLSQLSSNNSREYHLPNTTWTATRFSILKHRVYSSLKSTTLLGRKSSLVPHQPKTLSAS